MGYTPDITVGVWVGNSDNAPMEEVAGLEWRWPDLARLDAGL